LPCVDQGGAVFLGREVSFVGFKHGAAVRLERNSRGRNPFDPRNLLFWDLGAVHPADLDPLLGQDDLGALQGGRKEDRHEGARRDHEKGYAPDDRVIPFLWLPVLFVIVAVIPLQMADHVPHAREQYAKCGDRRPFQTQVGHYPAQQEYASDDGHADAKGFADGGQIHLGFLLRGRRVDPGDEVVHALDADEVGGEEQQPSYAEEDDGEDHGRLLSPVTASAGRECFHKGVRCVCVIYTIPAPYRKQKMLQRTFRPF